MDVNPFGPRPFWGPAPAHVLPKSSGPRDGQEELYGSFDAPSPCGDFDMGGSYPYSSSHGGGTPKACFGLIYFGRCRETMGHSTAKASLGRYLAEIGTNHLEGKADLLTQ